MFGLCLDRGNASVSRWVEEDETQEACTNRKSVLSCEFCVE